MFKTGRTTPQELFKACLKRAKFVDKLNAFITILEDPGVKSKCLFASVL